MQMVHDVVIKSNKWIYRYKSFNRTTFDLLFCF